MTAAAHPAGDSPMVAVVGPTASGKSALALRIAEELGGEILSTDSQQVYRHFDIGTAKPSAEERARVPHHLIDVVAPDETYSAGRYLRDAQLLLGRLRTAGRLPVLCGGTGLYFRALLYGLAEIPPVPPAVREAVLALCEGEGLAACRAELARRDPEGAVRLHPNDRARILRALEVHRATGRPLAGFQRDMPFREPPPHVLWVGTRWERAALYARIDARVEEMLARGWVDEVRGILGRGYSSRCKPFRAIGYREIAAWLAEGEPVPEAALAAPIARRTRQYAKRQLTWFGRQPGIRWAAPGEEARSVAEVRNFLKSGGRPR